MNEPCYIGIFDAHDMWHFLSALGIFFAFMFILTLGTGQTQAQHSKLLHGFASLYIERRVGVVVHIFLLFWYFDVAVLMS
jgi:hypothetical protein